METNAKNLIEKVVELFNQKKTDEIITLLTDDVLTKSPEIDNVAELYIWRGNIWLYNIIEK